MHASFALFASKQHGWRFEKLRPKFKKWVRIHHPPQNRSPVIKLDDGSNKLLYITNGRIAQSKHEEFMEYGKTYVRKEKEIHTPCIAFAKGGSHILLEVFAMDEIEQIEEMVPEIQRAFDECESKIAPLACMDHKAIDYGKIK